MSGTKGVLEVLKLALLPLAGIFVGWLMFRGAHDGAATRGSSVTSANLLGALPGPQLDRARDATVFIQVKGSSYLRDGDTVEGSGTGFLLSSTGHIVTNWHVVSCDRPLENLTVPMRLDELRVFFHSGARDQHSERAHLVAADPEADLAIIKVPGEGYAHLPLGDSDLLVETAPVWITGFPFGNLFSVMQRGPEISVNHGYVSSLRHGDRGTLKRIQFDAAVNRGNSGGPLVLLDGKAYGVTSSAMGTSRVNFAVPSAYVLRLLEECPPDAGVGETCDVRFESTPSGARVYVDSAPLGVTPLEYSLAGGYRHVVISAEGYRSSSSYRTVYDGKKIAVVLAPSRLRRAEVGPEQDASASDASPLPRGTALLSIPFDAPDAAESWTQETGGQDERTWYVEDGALHQSEADGLLHAVFGGEPAWEAYSFSARVMIDENESDGRAGLIFHSTPDGFALFRLFSGSNRVQLAYHSSDPFGWYVLAERPLALDVKTKHWYAMEVQTAGNSIVCLLDGDVVLSASTEFAGAGGVGFYSVDSRASFDDALVAELADTEPPPTQRAVLQSFWFTAQFAKDGSLWEPYLDGQPAAPWRMTSGGCVQLEDDDAQRTLVLSRHELFDFEARCLISCVSGAAGLVLRRDGADHYGVCVRPAEAKVVFFLQHGDELTELGTGDTLGAARTQATEAGTVDRPYDLIVRANKDRFDVIVDRTPVIGVNDATLAHGQIGLSTRGGRAIFHSLTVSSIRER
jgi:S1-C subfamily serine protease